MSIRKTRNQMRNSYETTSKTKSVKRPTKRKQQYTIEKKSIRKQPRFKTFKNTRENALMKLCLQISEQGIRLSHINHRQDHDTEESILNEMKESIDLIEKVILYTKVVEKT
ncbi:MAG: hypothetical protein ACTSWZ_05870 [Candidatus Heimdallarchaeaceae archaeon]